MVYKAPALKCEAPAKQKHFLFVRRAPPPVRLGHTAGRTLRYSQAGAPRRLTRLGLGHPAFVTKKYRVVTQTKKKKC